MNSPPLVFGDLVDGQLYVLELNNQPKYYYLARYSGLNMAQTLNFMILRFIKKDGSSWSRFTDDDFQSAPNSRRPNLYAYRRSEMNENNKEGYKVYSLDALEHLDVPDGIPEFEEKWGGGKRKLMRKSKRCKSKRRKLKRRKSMSLFSF
jgi:hypothetical protein